MIAAAGAVPEGRGALPLLVARVLQLGNAFAVSVAVVWAYGLDSAGALALAALPAAVGSLVIGFGLPSALPRAALPEAQKATLGLTSSCLLMVLVAPLIWGYAILLARSAEEAVAIAALAGAGALLGQLNVLQTLYVLQGRQAWAPLVPALHLAGTAIAASAPDFRDFALALLATRVLGCAIGFAPLSFARVEAGAARAPLREALRFTPLDLGGLLAEQLPLVLLSGLLTRPELGLFGLLRQFVSAADTPGWSFVFNSYPRLVADAAGSGRQIARQNERLAWISAVGTFAVACVAALALYRLPGIIPALPIVLLPMPARYLSNFCEQALRASGFLRDCALLAVARIALALVLFGILAATWGFWGAVIASGLLSLVSGAMYRVRLSVHFPDTLRSASAWRLA